MVIYFSLIIFGYMIKEKNKKIGYILKKDTPTTSANKPEDKLGGG